MLDKDLINSLGVLLGGAGAFIGSIAKLIEVTKKPKEKQPPKPPRRQRKVK